MWHILWHLPLLPGTAMSPIVCALWACLSAFTVLSHPELLLDKVDKAALVVRSSKVGS